MTSLLEGARRLMGRSQDIGARVEGLDAACMAARGRLDERIVDVSQAIVDRVVGRMRLSADHTVVAIAGATGSGKSSTFNALTGMELSAVGVRRPTTSWATACVWGSDGAPELLEWLGIPGRHQVTRDTALGSPDDNHDLEGVVLLDLPDHDSTEVAHHLEVDRLIEMADLMVWVLDPQKYADAAIHERYLAPLAMHQEVMVVVLNHIDRVPPDRQEAMVADVRRLLDADGLPKVPVYAISALYGYGVDGLRSEIGRRVADKKATKARMTADIKAAAAKMQEVSGTGRAAGLSSQRVAALDAALADAAGVPTVVEAVRESTRIRANRATGWPVTAWFTKLKPDPLKRLHLNLGRDAKDLTAAPRTSMPAPNEVVKARVESEVRELSDQVSEGLSRPWETAIRKASIARLADLNDRLDRALATTELGAERLPRWAGVVRFFQWLLLLTGLAGAGWLLALAVMRFLAFDPPPAPQLAGVLPWPLVLLIGGVVAGLLLAMICRVLVSMTARRRAHAADDRLRDAVEDVSRELVVQPIQYELDAYEAVRAGLAKALK